MRAEGADRRGNHEMLTILAVGWGGVNLYSQRNLKKGSKKYGNTLYFLNGRKDKSGDKIL